MIVMRERDAVHQQILPLTDTFYIMKLIPINPTTVILKGIITLIETKWSIPNEKIEIQINLTTMLPKVL